MNRLTCSRCTICGDHSKSEFCKKCTNELYRINKDPMLAKNIITALSQGIKKLGDNVKVIIHLNEGAFIEDGEPLNITKISMNGAYIFLHCCRENLPDPGFGEA